MFQGAKLVNLTADESKVHQAIISMWFAGISVSCTLQCFFQPFHSNTTSLADALIFVASHKKILLNQLQNFYFDVLRSRTVQNILAYQQDGIRTTLELVR